MTPLTSIIIPVHNRLDLTIECLRSIEDSTGLASLYEIILVDDASSDGTADWVRKNFTDIKIITNNARENFAHNNNAAARVANGEFLCLLNNDTIVLAGWLDEMLAVARADERIGVVGNRHITPGTDQLNHGGMAFDQRYNPVHICVGNSKNDPRALETRDMQCVTAACWLVRKRIFMELGGFDTNFKNGYEDVDFCLKASAAGFRIVYVGKSAIYHYGQSSPGRLAHDEWNAQLLREKWRGRIFPDLHKFTQTPPWDAPRQDISSPAPIRQDTDVHFAVPVQFGNAFTWSAMRLASACENAGMKVSFDVNSIHSSIDRKDRAILKTFMSRAPSRKFQIRWGHFWHPYINRTLTAEINAELMAINYLYPPQPLHNLDFWMRHTVMNGYIKLPMSGYCAETLRNIGVPDRQNLILHHGFSPEVLQATGAGRPFAEFDFVFLAITNSHDPYRYGTDVLISAFAKAFAGRSDVLLVLKDYGMQTGIVDAWVRSAKETVAIRHLKKFVSKSDLIDLYRCAHVFVAPFRGEGFGMKIVDACALGMPVIAPRYSGPNDFLVEDDFYSIAFRGIPVAECLDSTEGIVPPYATWCDPSEDDLAAQMIRSYEDHRRGVRLGDKNRSLVLRDFSWEASARRLIEIANVASDARQSVIDARPCKFGGKDISVVMPTFRRPSELRKTLDAYCSQNLEKRCWEILVADDCSGSEFHVREVVSEFKDRIPVTFREMERNSGPGHARNDIVLEASGNIILFTGDDIIPSRHFLAEHLRAQKGLGKEPVAVLGYTAWDQDLPVSEMMDFITAEGGHQFAFFGIEPYKPANSPLYFYTSNVSLPRALLFDQEVMFSPNFTGAAYEDCELGYRIAQRSGMKLYFNPDALGYHNHPMPDDYIFRRQYNVGVASVAFFLMHPELMDPGIRQAFEKLELVQQASQLGETFDDFETGMTFDAFFQSVCEYMDRSAEIQNRLKEILNGKPRCSQATTVAASQEARRQIFNTRLSMARLCGMADGWFGAPSGCSDVAKFLLCEEHFRWRWSAAGVSFDETLTGLQRRVALIERLRKTRPVIGSTLESIVRIAGSVAKRADLTARKASSIN